MIKSFIEHRLFPTTVYQNEIPVNQNEFTTIKEMTLYHYFNKIK